MIKSNGRETKTSNGGLQKIYIQNKYRVKVAFSESLPNIVI